MHIKRYADDETAQMIREAIVAANGHCPCSLEQFRNDDTRCMCKEFREAPSGTICHCGMYIKVED